MSWGDQGPTRARMGPKDSTEGIPRGDTFPMPLIHGLIFRGTCCTPKTPGEHHLEFQPTLPWVPQPDRIINTRPNIGK